MIYALNLPPSTFNPSQGPGWRVSRYIDSGGSSYVAVIERRG